VNGKFICNFGIIISESESPLKKSFLAIIFVLITTAVYSQPKPKLMWFDATANFTRFSYTDSILYYLDKIKGLGFTDAVIDVKPISGEVLYNSQIAPVMKEWDGFKRRDFDFLGTFIKEGHKRGIKVHASLNMFVGGHNFIDRGIVYSEEDKRDWQSVNYTDSGMVEITKLKHKYSAMLNPVNRAVRNYQLSILRELVEMYPELDGVILDRTRYDCIEADFSEISRDSFEAYMGIKLEKYPDDIFKWGDKNGKKEIERGKYFKEWLEWRAGVIYSFFEEARIEVKLANPKIIFGDYTGAWYPLYYELGVNWASKNYDPSTEYDWATETYKYQGYAELLDLYTTGCYFFEVTKEEVLKLNDKQVKSGEAGLGKIKEPWYSVEGSAEIAKRVVMGAVPVIGGLYVEQYVPNPEQFAKAVSMCLKKTDGLMIFDIVHLINRDWWKSLELGIRDYELGIEK